MCIHSVSELLDAFALWRFFLAAAVGVGVGLVVYYAAGQDPASAAIAFGMWLAGLCFGLVWHVVSKSRR